MPLHDGAVVPGWDGVHQVWMVELLYWIKPRLPAGYRAYIGTTPAFAIRAARWRGGRMWAWRDWPQEEGPRPPGDGQERRQGSVPQGRRPGRGDGGRHPEPGTRPCLVERQGRLVAAIELVSPRNKDRASACWRIDRDVCRVS